MALSQQDKKQVETIDFEILKIKKELQNKPAIERDFKQEVFEREQKIRKSPIR